MAMPSEQSAAANDLLRTALVSKRGTLYDKARDPLRFSFFVFTKNWQTAASISGGDKNGPFGKLFSRSLAMSAPSASTVTQPRSAAAKAARGRGRASLRHRPASSSSSPRSTTSCAPCRATTTMRTRAVSTPRLHVSSQRIIQTNKCTHHISVRALIAFIS